MYTARSSCHSDFHSKKSFQKMLPSLTCLTASSRPVLVFCSTCCIAQDVRCEVMLGRFMVTVAVNAMMRNNPTRKTLTKLMMTTMTTVLHRDQENDWSNSPFPLYKLLVFLVPFWSTRSCCLLLVGFRDRVPVFFRGSCVILFSNAILFKILPYRSQCIPVSCMHL